MVVTHFGRTGMALAAILFGATACGGNDGAADTAGSDTGAVQSAGGDVAGSNMASPAMVMAFRATVDQAEIEAGQLAQGKATNAQVKQFARMIVTDHRRAHAMADSASGMAGTAGTGTAGTGTAGTGTAGTGAAAAGGQPVADLMAMHQQAMTALQNAAKGRVFDSTYVALMIAGHQDVLSRLEGMRGASGSVAGTGAGATAAGGALSGTGGTGAGGQMQLESWSETIRTHLARAQELQRTIQGATR